MYYTEENEKYHKDIKSKERLKRVALYLFFRAARKCFVTDYEGIAALENLIVRDRDGRDPNHRS